MKNSFKCYLGAAIPEETRTCLLDRLAQRLTLLSVGYHRRNHHPLVLRKQVLIQTSSVRSKRTHFFNPLLTPAFVIPFREGISFFKPLETGPNFLNLWKMEILWQHSF